MQVNRTAKDTGQWPERLYANVVMIMPDLITALACCT